MARLERFGNLVACFERGQIRDIFGLDSEALSGQIAAPSATTTSGWRFINLHKAVALLGGFLLSDWGLAGRGFATSSQQRRSE